MNCFIMTAAMAFITVPASQAFAFVEADYDFNGTVALSNCSGSLIRFDDSADDDQAMILSNGHCVARFDPGVVKFDLPDTRTFDILNAKGSTLGTVRAQKLLYATMTKTDMSLYQLVETYEQIRSKFEVEAFTLARSQPVSGTAIEVVSGSKKRGYSCKIEATVHKLQEGNWLFESSIRYSRPGCEVIGGTSGAPVIEAGTRTVIAVNNTGNVWGLKCVIDNPCEIDEDGVVLTKMGYGYAQQTFWVYTCRNAEGIFDLSVSSCLLPRP